LENKLADGIKVTVKVDLGGLDKKLMELEPKIQRKLMRTALKAVGVYWVEAVKSRAPVLIGDLKNSIISRIRTRKSSRGTVVGEVQVGPGTAPRTDDHQNSVGPSIYASWVEFGLKTKDYPKQPFMRPAFDATAEKAIELFADTLREGLADALNDYVTATN
jgi:HK97 gp10 family phage protein